MKAFYNVKIKKWPLFKGVRAEKACLRLKKALKVLSELSVSL
jgi:hypothetical protein